MRIPGVVAAGVLLCVAACGGGGSAPASYYAVGGTVGGLQGGGLVLLNNGGDNLNVSASSTTFTFATKVASGNPFNVTVMTQPSNPSQACVVAHASGTVTGNDITNVAVTCTTNNYTLSGTVSGLSGSGLVIGYSIDPSTLTYAATLAVTNSGSFTFPTSLPSGTAYTVQIVSNPTSPLQGCSVANGTGVVGGANVNDLTVVCNMASEELVLTDGNVLVPYPIDPDTGVAAPTGAPPMNLAVRDMVADPTAKNVYATSGSSSDLGGFSVDAATGQLVPVSGSPYAIAGSPAGLVMDHLGKFLYVSLSTLGAFGFSRNPADGSLTPIAGSPFPWVQLPFNGSMASQVAGFTAASSKFIYYPVPLFGVGRIQLCAFQIDATTGALTSLGAVSSEGQGSGSIGTIDPAGTFLYYEGFTQPPPTVLPMRIDPTSGALTPNTLPSEVTSEGSLVLTFSGRYLYVSSSALPGAVLGYSVDATTGALTPLPGSPFATGVANAVAGALALDRTDKFLYVSNPQPTGAQLVAFAVDAATGALTLVPASRLPTSLPSRVVQHMLVAGP